MMKNSLDVLAGILVVALGLLIGNLATNKVSELVENRSSPPGIQIDKENIINFVIDVNTYLPSKFEPVVRLEVDIDEKHVTGVHCSGTVINDDYVLTAAHCLVNDKGFLKKSIYIRSSNYSQSEDELISSQKAIPVAINRRADYGLVKGDFKLFNKLKMDASSIAAFKTRMQDVISCGFPWGDVLTCYPVSSMSICGIKYCGHSLIYPAMSGGPLIDRESGKVVAVNYGYNDVSSLFNPLVGLLSSFGIKVEYK